MAAPVECTLLVESSGEHLNQVYAGFALLKARGLVRLTPSMSPQYRPGILGRPLVRVLISEGPRLVYDLRDADDIDLEYLAWANFYFKRSYDPRLHLDRKLRPLGHNYPVYAPSDMAWVRLWWSIRSCRSWGDLRLTLAQAFRSLSPTWMRATNQGRRNCSHNRLEALPPLSFGGRVVFFTRLWDPGSARNVTTARDRESMNAMRVGCVRVLRRRFASQFCGGLEPTPYARAIAPELIAEPYECRKQRYLEHAREASIGISTRGLQNSTPWKLGEYVALARAIVTERMRFTTSGNFSEGVNFLTFDTPDECVKQVERLLANRPLLQGMMKANHDYYHAYQRPDSLVWNTLATALLSGDSIRRT